MSVNTFVDTSVLVWTQDASDPVRQLRALERLRLEQVTGLPTVSANVLAEMFVALSKRRGPHPPLYSPEEAARRVEVAATFHVVAVQKEHVLEALRLKQRHQLQWWDALNVASARAAGCTLFLTADFPSAQVIEGLRFEDPIGERA